MRAISICDIRDNCSSEDMQLQEYVAVVIIRCDGTQLVRMLYEGVGRDIPASKNEVQDVFPCEYLPINTLKMVFVFLQIPSLPLKGGQLRYFKLLKNKKDCVASRWI